MSANVRLTTRPPTRRNLERLGFSRRRSARAPGPKSQPRRCLRARRARRGSCFRPRSAVGARTRSSASTLRVSARLDWGVAGARRMRNRAGVSRCSLCDGRRGGPPCACAGKIRKLREGVAERQSEAQAAGAGLCSIFRGVCVWVDGFTSPSHAEIQALLVGIACHRTRFAARRRLLQEKQVRQSCMDAC